VKLSLFLSLDNVTGRDSNPATKPKTQSFGDPKTGGQWTKSVAWHHTVHDPLQPYVQSPTKPYTGSQGKGRWACLLQAQIVPEDHVGTSHLRAPWLAPWQPGLHSLERPIRTLSGWPFLHLYSQIFEVCGSSKSLPGDSLEGILTQVPGRTKSSRRQERTLVRKDDSRVLP
jgi:hypothetical protein